MKKIACLVLLVIICCSLCACDPRQYTIDQNTLDNVISIELIQYENPKQKEFATWVPNQFYRLASFVPANATVIETLPSEKNAEFLQAFSKTYILHTYYAYNSPKDICLRLNYKNGDFLIVWANYAESSYAGYIGEYSSDGTVLSFWGSFGSLIQYENLVNQFFTHTLQ